MPFKYTTALSKIRKLDKRVRVVQGGSSASKTWSIIPILIDKAARIPNTSISIVSESLPHLKKGAMRDFINIMRMTNRYIDDHWNRSNFTYYFSNGSYIEFFAVDNEQKARGPRRQYLFVNEANAITWDIYYQLAIRTSEVIYVDYNPSSSFWVHDTLLDDPDTDFITLTYKDNEALSESLVRELEKALPRAFYDITLPRPELYKESNVKNSYWAGWCKVYLFGELGTLDGVIFNNWKQIPELPRDASLIGCGLDFGYSVDPTAIVAVYSWNGKRILHELCYQTGLVNAEVAKMLPSNVTVYADSAEPKSIEEIRRSGRRIMPVRKGSDSINFGIQVMQSQDYLVTASSINLIKELRNYLWDTDRTGKTLNKPIDMYNHAIDAVRYHEMMNIGIRRNATKARLV